VGRAAVPALTALIDLLQDAEPSVRQSAAEALGSLGEGSQDACPALAALRRDRHEGVRRAAAAALEKVARR
jgi:HEAT repeat protein